jgi:hypothetical protein
MRENRRLDRGLAVHAGWQPREGGQQFVSRARREYVVDDSQVAAGQSGTEQIDAAEPGQELRQPKKQVRALIRGRA